MTTKKIAKQVKHIVKFWERGKES